MPCQHLSDTHTRQARFARCINAADETQRQHRLPLCCDAILCNVVTAVGLQSTKGGIELAILTRIQYGHIPQLSPVLDFPACHGLVVKLKALEVNDQGVRQALDAAALHSIHLSTTNVALPM